MPAAWLYPVSLLCVSFHSESDLERLLACFFFFHALNWHINSEPCQRKKLLCINFLGQNASVHKKSFLMTVKLYMVCRQCWASGKCTTRPFSSNAGKVHFNKVASSIF